MIAVSATAGVISFVNPKAEFGNKATPFNDAATLAYIAGYRATNDFGFGLSSPMIRLGDATSTSAKWQARSAAGAQAYDYQLSVSGGTSGTAGKANAAMETRSFSNTGAIGYAQEFNAGNSGTAITIDFATNGPRQRTTLTGNATVTLSGFSVVGNYRVKGIQDGTGSRTITFTGVPITWAGADTPTALGANAVAFYDFYWDGSTAWASWTPW
jgi:hypothetical protein